MFSTNTCSQEIPYAPWDSIESQSVGITRSFRYHQTQPPHFTKKEAELLMRQGTCSGSYSKSILELRVEPRSPGFQSNAVPTTQLFNAWSYLIFPSWATFSLMTHLQTQQVSTFFKGRSGLKVDKIIVNYLMESLRTNSSKKADSISNVWSSLGRSVNPGIFSAQLLDTSMEAVRRL